MILSAQTIRDVSPISPFHERTVHNGMTFGLSACGYDVRIAQSVTLEPGQFTLASTIEHFKIPNWLVAFVKDKSTWARRGVCVQNTVAEPGWRGFLTIELSNHSSVTICVEAGDPIAQIVFQMLDKTTDLPYVGKYQDQPNRPVAAIRSAAPPAPAIDDGTSGRKEE